jgi:HEAT repeat protein
MAGARYPHSSVRSSIATRRSVSSRLARSLLMVLLGALLLTLVELGFLWLFNPPPGRNSSQQLAALISLPLHLPLLWLIPLAEVVAIASGTFALSKPLAMLAYSRDVLKAQERSRARSASLPAPAAMYRTTVAYFKYTPDTASPQQEQHLPLAELVASLQDHSLLLLGMAGAGKTFALRQFQCAVLQQRSALRRAQPQAHRKIPIYLPLKYYSLYLKAEQRGRPPADRVVDEQEQPLPPSARPRDGTLLTYLSTCELPGIPHLRPYLKKLLEQGRLILLCDGLDEVDPLYRATIAAELTELLRATANRCVITCRELDLEEQQTLLTLVNEGRLERALLQPLQIQQVREFVEQYIEDRHEARRGAGQYTAGQIMQFIEQSRLRHLCTSPLMLITLLEIIDALGIERCKQLDTRGRVLQEYTLQLLERVKQRPGRPGDSKIVHALRTIASAARWANDPYAIDFSDFIAGGPRAHHSEAVARALLAWAGEHQAWGPLASAPAPLANDPPALAGILDCAASAGLIEFPERGILSFRHALLADYLLAEYFLQVVGEAQGSSAALASDLLVHVETWSNPVALWAGLLDDPLQLADWFVKAGGRPSGGVPVRNVQLLVLSMICVGVAWIPPQAANERAGAVPSRLPGLLSKIVEDASGRQMLAHLCILCAEEGVQEIYYALLPLLMVEGIEECVVLLAETVVPEMLFTYLCDIVDLAAFDAQVKRLCRILMQFGALAVARAEQLSLPAPASSLRLRAAAINILGGTRAERAIQPLLRCLADKEQLIVERASIALQRLGPELILAPILRELEERGPGPSTQQVHAALLAILTRYLEEKDLYRRLSLKQYERILESALAVLSANYAFEAEVQRLAQRLLVGLLLGQIAAPATEIEAASADASGKLVPASGSAVLEMLFHLLVKSLSSADEVLVRNVAQVLQQAGQAATPFLLEHLRRRGPEIERVRLVEILKNVRDLRSLPDLLGLIADPSLLLQQQVLQALRIYSPESIPGLIHLLLEYPSDRVAERAATILGELGEQVVVPLTRALPSQVPGRTRLLVEVAKRLRDRRTLPALVGLLGVAQADALLTIAVIRALSQFATEEVVTPILEAIASPQAQVYEEAIDALSSLGSVALQGLLGALNVREETPSTPRVRRALLGMRPFPARELVQALERASDGQARQIMTVLRVQGADAAQELVRHLFDENLRLRRYARQTLTEMVGAIAVPPLLEVLSRVSWRNDAGELLLSFPEAMSPLVNLLGDPERAEAAFAILPRFGPAVLTPLISGLADARLEVQVYAQNIIVTLTQKEPAALVQVVRLFSSPLPLRAQESLLEVLTTDLAPGSIPVLLEGLEDAYLVEQVSEALLRLARKPDWQKVVLDGLLTSLRREERRRGSGIALIKMGALAVRRVGELITDPDQQLARAAQHILLEIGAPALSFIWSAHGDTSNRARRDAAMQVFHSMPTEAIKAALVELLKSEKAEDIAMAQALLLERISDEEAMPQANHEMIPALLEYVQLHEREIASQRIFALLILLGGEVVVKHLVAVLYAYPEHNDQLTHALLFLGAEAQAALLRILKDVHAPARLRGEAVSTLGLLDPGKEVYEHAQSLNKAGLSKSSPGVVNPDELTVALRALGSLLASGDWDIPTLQNLRRISQEGSSEHELYQVLLGRRLGPEIARLQNELQKEREARKSEIMSLTARIVQNHERIHELEEQLEQTRHEHGERGDELFQATQEREALRKELETTLQERENYRGIFDKVRQEREVFRSSLEQALQMQQALQAEVTQLQSYNELLQQQLKQRRVSR